MADKEEDYEFEVGPLSDFELKRLRRMLQEDHYARRFKSIAKVWVITIGSAIGLIATCVTAFKEIAERLLK